MHGARAGGAVDLLGLHGFGQRGNAELAKPLQGVPGGQDAADAPARVFQRRERAVPAVDKRRPGPGRPGPRIVPADAREFCAGPRVAARFRPAGASEQRQRRIINEVQPLLCMGLFCEKKFGEAHSDSDPLGKIGRSHRALAAAARRSDH
jgi:hypothetical protein